MFLLYDHPCDTFHSARLRVKIQATKINKLDNLLTWTRKRGVRSNAITTRKIPAGIPIAILQFRHCSVNSCAQWTGPKHFHHDEVQISDFFSMLAAKSCCDGWTLIGPFIQLELVPILFNFYKYLSSCSY